MSSYWDPSDNSGWFNQEQPNQPPPNHNNYQWDFNSAHNQQQPVYDGNYGYSSGPSPDEGYPNWQTTQDAQYYPPPSISDSTSQYGGQMFIPANNPPQQRDYAKGFQGDDVLIEDERPLLEELGINFDHICQKTLAVLNPLKRPDADAVTDQVTKQEYSQMYNCLRMVCFSDLAGPLVFALMFGGSLLLHGKVQFGYIYGIGALGCLGMYFILNMMSAGGISFTCTVSVLGYCLLPMAMLSALAAVLSFKYKLRINLHKAQAVSLT